MAGPCLPLVHTLSAFPSNSLCLRDSPLTSAHRAHRHSNRHTLPHFFFPSPLLSFASFSPRQREEEGEEGRKQMQRGPLKSHKPDLLFLGLA